MSTETTFKSKSEVPQSSHGRASLQHRQLRDLPGPRGIPVFGNLLQLKGARPHQTVERWAKQYGPFFRMRLGSRPVLVVSDHEAIAGILRKRPELFQRTSRLGEVTAEMGLYSGVFVSNGEAWKRQRRLVMAAFDPAHVRTYYPALVQVAIRLRGRWAKSAADGSPIDLLSDLTRYTVDGVAGLAFGASVNTIEDESDIIQNHLDKIFPAMFRRYMAPLPYWRYLKLRADRELPGHVEAINLAVRNFIADARARMELDPDLCSRPTNLLEAMLAAAAKEGAAISDEEISGNVFTMLLAGEDTTANTLAWLIWLLSKNSSAMRRCAEEINDVREDLAELTMDQLSRMTFLDACVNETMRIKPVAPFMINEATQVTTVGDVDIGAGTLTWSVLRSDTVDERYFVEPKSFAPDRWIQDSMQKGSSAKRIAMPFGGGPRICPGRYLALLEIKLALVMLLSSFKIEEVYPLDGGEPQENMSIVMAPVGLRMRLSQ